MNTEAIKEIMEAFETSALSKMELEVDDMKLKLEKAVASEVVVPASPQISVPVSSKKTEEKIEEVNGTWIKAPLVGTYYNARSAGSTPFVEVGQHVKKGDALCIIEAMKVMNEIHAPQDGVIAEILVTNESMVEYDQDLIRMGDAL